MNKAFLILLFFFSCEPTNEKHPCVDYQITILALETEIEKQFQEVGKLKEQLENSEEYIQLLEQEKDSLKNPQLAQASCLCSKKIKSHSESCGFFTFKNFVLSAF